MRRIIVPLMLVAALTGCAVPTETAAPPAAGAQAQPSENTTAPPKPKHWVTVAKLSGNGNKRGEAFHLSGGDAKLSYSVRDTSGYGVVSLAVYVVGKGDSLEESGGFPEVMADNAGKDSTRLAKGEGDYYLDVQAANARWSITVQETRS